VLLANVVLLRCSAFNDARVVIAPRHRRHPLTVGMAVDANVLIYERIREEVRRLFRPRRRSGGLREGVFGHCRFQRHHADSRCGVVVFGTGPFAALRSSLTLGIGPLCSRRSWEACLITPDVRRQAKADPPVDLRLTVYPRKAA